MGSNAPVFSLIRMVHPVDSRMHLRHGVVRIAFDTTEPTEDAECDQFCVGFIANCWRCVPGDVGSGNPTAAAMA